MKDQKDNTTGLGMLYFPAQAIKDSEKTEDFFKKCIDSGLNLTYWNSNNINTTGVRQSRKNKIINFQLYNGVLSRQEIERIVNPFRLQNVDFPAEFKNYPLLTQNINLLVGEEIKRTFRPVASVVNPDIQNKRLEEINNKYKQFLIEQLLKSSFSEQDSKQDLDRIAQWDKYGYKDRHERMVQQLLNYGFKVLKFNEIFSRGFKDFCISGEEAYVADIYGNEPIIRKLNPVNLYTLRSGESTFHEDSDVIVEDGYISIGEVINRYHDELTREQIKLLESGYNTARTTTFGSELLNPTLSLSALFDPEELVYADKMSTFIYGGFFDSEGNVRVTRVLWRGMRLIYELSYFDEDGNKVKKYVDSNYKPNKELGEETKELYINEWYEGTKIGHDIYIRMRPLPFRIGSKDNIAVAYPGIVGTTMNTNTNKGMSIVDLGKNYQYLFNFFMYKLEMLYIKSKGKIAELPMHLKPSNFSMDQWLYYGELMGWLPVDAFNEGMYGAATGKLAGGMSQGRSVLDMSFTNEIQQTFIMLEFCKNQLNDLVGITPQRKGAISNRETKGGIEMSLEQSSLSTEDWYFVHDNTKLRAIQCWIEVAKIAWKGKSIKKSFYMDDGTAALLEIDDTFSELEVGITVSNASEDMEVIQRLRGMSQVLAQNGATTSMLTDLARINNPTELQRRIDEYDAKLREEKQNEMNKQLESNERIQQQKIESDERLEMLKIQQKEKEIELEKYKIDTEAQVKIRTAEMTSLSRQENLDLNANNVFDTSEIADKALKERDIFSKDMNKRLELKIKEGIESKKISLERDKMKHEEKLQDKSDKAAMEREKLKAKVAIKNKVSGEK